jgi:hypothetical protein
MHREFRVPQACPLPRYCPVCGEPATRTSKLHAFEGIPLVITYHIKVPVHYCERHFHDLRNLAVRQWLSILLAPAFLLFAVAVEDRTSAYSSILMTSLVVATCASLFLSLYFGQRISRQRGIRIRTLGSSPTFLVFPSNESWAEKAQMNVARYHEYHATTDA